MNAIFESCELIYAHRTACVQPSGGNPDFGTSTIPKVVGGDPDRGRVLFAPCVACHGPSGKGNATTKAPPLAGLQDWYLLTQLEHFKSGVRARDPQDETGAQMRPFAEAIDEQGMEDVVAYIATLPWYR